MTMRRQAKQKQLRIKTYRKQPLHDGKHPISRHMGKEVMEQNSGNGVMEWLTEPLKGKFRHPKTHSGFPTTRGRRALDAGVFFLVHGL